MIKGDTWLISDIPTTAIAAADVVKWLRKDVRAKVNLKSALAVNELARSLGLEPVFTSRCIREREASNE